MTRPVLAARDAIGRADENRLPERRRSASADEGERDADKSEKRHAHRDGAGQDPSLARSVRSRTIVVTPTPLSVRNRRNRQPARRRKPPGLDATSEGPLAATPRLRATRAVARRDGPNGGTALECVEGHASANL